MFDVSPFFGGNYLTHSDLPQPFQIWTINKVDHQMVGQGSSAEEKVCVRFSEHTQNTVPRAHIRPINHLTPRSETVG